ncbi:NUDIX hydrolase [Candidatus Woesearchaeota archaeon]|nr:NUDIX hydrolase [Candidatus Woesearchaeota archaeon]
MKTRTIAIIVPYTKEGKVLLQKRHSISKWGEEWSFWGGGIDPGETKEQAARRELKEELDFDVQNLPYLGGINKIMKHIKDLELWYITYEIFVTPISGDLSQFHVHEGDGLGLFSLSEARHLKMAPIDSQALDVVEAFLSTLLTLDKSEITA